MSSRILEWYRPPKPSLIQRVKKVVRSESPLKPKLEHAIRYIRIHISKFDAISKRLTRRDEALFKRIIVALRRQNSHKASILANELAEIRKINRTITQCKLALEQIELRLNTVKDLGDIVANLAPAAAVVNKIRPTIITTIPAADSSMKEMSEILSSILVDTCQTKTYTLDFEAANEDAKKIIGEAYSVAEERLRNQLPKIPRYPQDQGITDRYAIGT